MENVLQISHLEALDQKELIKSSVYKKAPSLEQVTQVLGQILKNVRSLDEEGVILNYFFTDLARRSECSIQIVNPTIVVFPKYGAIEFSLREEGDVSFSARYPLKDPVRLYSVDKTYPFDIIYLFKKNLIEHKQHYYAQDYNLVHRLDYGGIRNIFSDDFKLE
ncbi:MAG: hypothetical protein PHG05_00010 [Candidatus Nanoarchaeia archaeon]|nr:hypothetical protein [Candidatus Nanoarchaeia archaeon]